MTTESPKTNLANMRTPLPEVVFEQPIRDFWSKHYDQPAHLLGHRHVDVTPFAQQFGRVFRHRDLTTQQIRHAVLAHFHRHSQD